MSPKIIQSHLTFVTVSVEASPPLARCADLFVQRSQIEFAKPKTSYSTPRRFDVERGTAAIGSATARGSTMAATSRGAPDARARLATTRAPNIGPHASAREPISRRRPAHPDAARVSPKFDLLAGACFPPRRTSQPADRDGRKNPRFHTLSDPVLWGHLPFGFKAIPAGLEYQGDAGQSGDPGRNRGHHRRR